MAAIKSYTATTAFEDSHNFVGDPADYSGAPGITIKQMITDKTALICHVMRASEGALLTEENTPDLDARANAGSANYPGWVSMGYVEVAK